MTNDERKILKAELYKLSPPAQEILKKFFAEWYDEKSFAVGNFQLLDEP
ncbi:MAG: hypothetical protein IJQ85_00010 [Selenomonadaceae bacterium]|nr:hypothetical protein [Selenomonadaceae bacterium]